MSLTKVNSSSYLQPLQVKKNKIAAELTRRPQSHPLLTKLHPCCPSRLSSLRSFSALDWLRHKKHLKRFLGSTINNNTCINITTSFLSRTVALDKPALLTATNSIATLLALEQLPALSEETPSPFFKYRIYSINRPGRLLNFWTLRVGAYSRWALIRGGR